MKKKLIQSILAVMVLAAFALPSMAQSSVSMTSTGNGVISFIGTGAGSLVSLTGNCTITGCNLAGTASGTVNGNAITGYNLNLPSPSLFLQGNGAGNFSASAGALVGSTVVLTGAGNAVVFTGTLTSLVISQSLTATNGVVSFVAVITGAGGATVTLNGSLVISGDSNNLNNLANGRLCTGTIGVVPEPGSMMLLSSGLIALGGMIRRRRIV